MKPLVWVVGDASGYTFYTERLLFRPMRADLHDGYYVAKWRNDLSARAAFFNTTVVTPDSHVAWMQQKSPYDLVWMAEYAVGNHRNVPLGMCGLVVEPDAYRAEAGRYFVDESARGHGYGLEMDHALFLFAFDYLRLESIWYDAWASNETVIHVHEKAGWRYVGCDLPGHCHAGGQVIHMELTLGEWQDMRDAS